MTKAEAVASATDAANAQQRTMEVWEHVGGRTPTAHILPQMRFVVRDPKDPPPRWVWARIAVIEPAGFETLPPAERSPEEVGRLVVERMASQKGDVPDPVLLSKLIAAAVREDRDARSRQDEIVDVEVKP